MRTSAPGGPAVERAAEAGDPFAVPLPRPLKGAAEPHFSFAGLKSAVVRAAREAGFDDYWLKPIDVPKLQAALQQLIG